VEALSRGAREAVFVESDRRARDLLAKCLAELGLSGRTAVAGEPVARFAARAHEAFDVVFFDPPWADDAAGDLRALLPLLASGGVLFHERGNDEDLLPERPADETRRYGRTRFFLYRV
jgi:16S rRNA (guanine966-N2)-methyltransferase